MTKNDLKGTIINTGYRGLQKLLVYHEPIGYNAGYWGWNWDVYLVDGIYILDAYRNVPASAIRPHYKLMQEYNNLGYGASEEEREELLKQFIKEVVY